ncbi:8.6 kDa transglutaminase substrate-like [Stegodyphus dumicola]|uniref:8.6 kDa transglutaminase substrate-like n=1 Tax=Stegodyphus dumicola TaxID=202533 RepID=UPI0015B0C913|nr:8.6 kDa transglutaminase substrate-like [Stegodyphus dumicola]
MKSAVYCLMFVAVCTLLIMNVECRSPRVCPEECDQSTCKKVSCKCGAFEDECNCCSICYKCPGEVCSTLQGDACAGSTKCRHTREMNAVDRYNSPGVCMDPSEGYP